MKEPKRLFGSRTLRGFFALFCFMLVGIGQAWAINAGDNIDVSKLSWTCSQGNGPADFQTGKETYSTSAYTSGKVMYQTLTNLEAGYYYVQFYGTANMAWIGAATGANIAEAYCNDGKYSIDVIGQTGCTIASDAYLRSFLVKVDAGGSIEYGIRNIATGGNWYVCQAKSVTYLGTSLQKNADLSNAIVNSSFESGNTAGWTNSGTISLSALKTSPANNPKVGDWFIEKWGASGSIDFNQTLANMPAGKYTIGARVRNEASTAVYVYANDSQTAVTQSSTAAYTTDLLMESAGDIKFGIKCDNHPGNTWLAADYFTMTYYGNGVEHYAVAQEGDAAADTWYKKTIEVAGKYNLTTDGTATIVYTQNGETEKSSITTSASSGDELTLSIGTIYYKASAATALTIAPSSYEYTLGSATSDKAYIQPGQTVTVSYASAATNDPSVSLGITTTGIQFGGNAVTVAATTNGFTFTVPTELAAGTDYTLEIPAGCAAYGAKASSEAQNITLKTPAAYDGRYYLKNAYNDNKYLSRGGGYATQAIVDEYGIAVVLTTDGDGNTDIKMFDSWLNLGFDGWVYTDTHGDNVRKFKMTKTDDGIKFLNTNNSKYLATNNGALVADAVEGDNLEGTSNVWTLENVNDHISVVKAYDDTQAVTAATQAGMDVDDLGIDGKAMLKYALAADYNGYQSKSIDITGTGGNVKENYQGGSSSAENSEPLAIFAEETVSGLKPGLYKLSVNAFQRATWIEDVCATGGARGKVYVYANDAKTQLASIAEYAAAEAYTGGWNPDAEVDGLHYPNNTTAANAAFTNGQYVNDVFVYVPADEGSTTGTLKFGIKNPTRLGNDGERGAWTCFNNFTLTYYNKYSLDDAYADLAAALDAYKPWTESEQVNDYVSTYEAIKQGYEMRMYQSPQEVKENISELQKGFKTYSWDHANMAHPYDATAGVISNADIAQGNEDWLGSGRSTQSVTYYDGKTKTVFTQNHENGAARSQGIVIPKAGAYILRSYVKVPGDGYATIDLSGTSTTTTTTGNEGGDLGGGWVYNDIMFYTAEDNTDKTISIALSNENNNRVAYFGEIHLLYIGQNCDYAKNGIHYYMGNYTSAPSFVLTNEEPVVDATGASVTGASVTRTNANGIVYLASGSTADGGKNIVIDGTCANFTLTDGSPVTIPTAFTATSATYNMTAIAGDKFGTLVLPFAVTVPTEGKAYKLTGDVIMGDELTATETSIEANKPVLVTKAGAYTGSNVEVAATNAGTLYTNGNLTGVYQATTAAEGIYVLQNHTATEGVAFYLVGAKKPTVNPFRAYIPAQSNGAKAISIVFDDEWTTGVKSINNEEFIINNDACMFDLHGRRVKNAQKGIYIINGKKVVK